jgi:molybdate transport system substrate-binding protein
MRSNKMSPKQYSIIGLIAVIIILSSLIASGTLNGLNNSQKKTITVLSAAGLVKVSNDMKTEFEKENPDVTVNVKSGGSGELFGLLETQKNADIFIPGDYKYMQDAIDRGYIQNKTVKNVTKNIPVIAVQKGNPKNITSLKDLAKPGVKVALGDPNGPAIGKTSEKLLNKSGINESVQNNVIVKTTTVNQLLTYLVTGEADATIIWQDMGTWSESQGKIEIIEISQNENIISTVPIAVTVYTQNNDLTQKYEEFVTGPKGKAIWEKWGYETLF